MSTKDSIIFVEINNYEFIFVAGFLNENKNFELSQVVKTPLKGIQDKKITNLELVSNIIKENIYSIEQKSNFIFKEVILVNNYFNCSLINFTGFKKLNGSQLNKDNITYILNLLKSKISEIEKQKIILHIFNTKYVLDQKKIDNLPIGLFGNLYSQELSFVLIDKNDYKNLINIFEICNLRIKKIISKKFLDGVNIINKDINHETFFRVEINENDIEIIFFQNSALKFVQSFKFGSNLILNDISKVIALNTQVIRKILMNSNFSNRKLDTELVEKEFFDNNNYRKIRKKLIFEIAKARIEELSELVIYKNINIKSFLKKNSAVFLKINDLSSQKSFEECYRTYFSNNFQLDLKFLKDLTLQEFYNTASRIVQYGWKQEAVPIIQEKKSIIARFFNKIFN